VYSALFFATSSTQLPPASRTFNPSDCGPVTIYITPQETIDYAFDWTEPYDDSDDQASQYQLATGETIAVSLWAADGIEVTPSSIQNDNTLTTVWLSGGEAGNNYIVTNQVTTSAGRIYTASFNVVVANFN
jgi:hypothetical protein